MSWIIFSLVLRSFSMDIIIFLVSFRILVLSLVAVALFIGKALPGRLTIFESWARLYRVWRGLFGLPYLTRVSDMYVPVSIASIRLVVQEVPAFRDFWYQKGITKFGDHEF